MPKKITTEERKDAKVVCLHCCEENIKDSHKCIYELLDFIVMDMAEIMENQCGNSGFNFKRGYEYLKNEIIKNNHEQ